MDHDDDPALLRLAARGLLTTASWAAAGDADELAQACITRAAELLGWLAGRRERFYRSDLPRLEIA